MSEARANVAEPGDTISFSVNGRAVAVAVPPIKRLADVLRDDLGLTGTKIGCNAGDCGACTVLLDGRQVCACMVPAGQAEGKHVLTVEGLAEAGALNDLQAAFHRHGAAQCGICTPAMLMAATDLLSRNATPGRTEVMDALGGVLCRCTGYVKIVDAVMDAGGALHADAPQAGRAVGARIAKIDGVGKLTGAERFGADDVPADALWLRAVRSPHASARFTIGDLAPLMDRHRGLVRVLSAADVPMNGFGIYPDIKDQPVLARDLARYRGEAVLALVGPRETVEGIADGDLPIAFEPLDPVFGLEAAMADRAPLVQADKPGNLLIDGGLRKGATESGFAACAAIAEGDFETAFVEHAYIEPEAGWARRSGERIEIHVSTQAPYMDRDEIANVLKIAAEDVRIVPSACGGGFGGKLDLSLQPLIAVAAWLLDRPVACVYQRPESMAASTKRHPARIHARFGCGADGRLLAAEMDAVFDTGAYASWGPTVAGRVPIHASGPYLIPNVTARGRAYFSNGPPAGAFRGFGVPQAAIAHETLVDDLAEQLNIDRLEFRLANALSVGDVTATGQTLAASAGLTACLEALKPRWHAALAEAASLNARDGVVRRGVGIGCMWYGIGNTSMSNPSTMRVTLARDGALTLWNGAVDIGQGSNTILAQICADGIGVPVDRVGFVMGDTDLTADAGKTSASRQTFVSGKAAQLAGEDLRKEILRQFNAGPDAKIELEGSIVGVSESGVRHEIDLAKLPEQEDGAVLAGEGTFDPPTSAPDENGQGVPYATYAFAAQIAVVEVDTDLGTTKVRQIFAAHDVGRAINPTQVEGQIEGGIAQGLGLALMEEYLPGRTENLHDYLIPTFGDMPEIEIIIVEDREPLGPYGAKGVGEPGLVPTAPAILGAIRHAAGIRVTRVPALPHRVRAAILAKEQSDG